MNNYDELFLNSSEKKEKQSFDKDNWKQQKKQERQETYDLLNRVTDSAIKDGAQFQKYLDVQAEFENYSASNAMLIMEQMPEATQLKSYGAWKKEGMSVKQGAKSIRILEPGKSFTRPDGTRGTYYNVKKVFDVTQIEGEVKREQMLRLDDRTLIKSLIAKSPVPIVNVDELANNLGALYDHEQKRIFVRRGMNADNIFRSVSNELLHAELAANNNNYNRKEAGFTAYCASYLLCKRNGVDVSAFRFDSVPMELKGTEPKEARTMLENVRKTANTISERMNRAMDRGHAPKTKEQER